MPPLLYLFALTNLVIGTGAFVLSGVIKLASEGLGVSVAAAGQAMTAYAFASAFLAPVLMVLTGKWARKRALQAALLLYGLGCLLCALAPNLSTLLLGRIMMGTGAMFTPLAAGLTVAMVPPQMRARALALSFLGIGMSYAIGLPIGTWLGFHVDWRAPLWLVTACCALALLASSVLLPTNIEAPGASFAGLGALMRHTGVLRVLVRSLLYFMAIFSVFAFVGPVLQALNPLSANALSATLVMFGLAGVIGTFLGGWSADRFGPVPTLGFNLGILCTMMALVPLTQDHYLLCVTVFIVWGLAGFALMAPQQSRLAHLMPMHTPLLLSLNASMMYIGTAMGAAISGAVLDTIGFEKLAWVGLPLALLALTTVWWDRRA